MRYHSETVFILGVLVSLQVRYVAGDNGANFVRETSAED